MTAYTSRVYSGGEDLKLLIKFAEMASVALMPLTTYLKPGDVVWAMYNIDRTDDIRLWFDADGLAAYAMFDALLHVDFDIHPDCPIDEALLDTILVWAEDRRRAVGLAASMPKAYAMIGNNVLSTKALQSDARRIAMIERRGYSRIDRFGVLYKQSLTEAVIEAPRLEPGLRLRHVTDDDLEQRVDLHRDGWSV